MTKGINRTALRQRRINALNRLENTKPKDDKHMKYLNKEIKRLKSNLERNN